MPKRSSRCIPTLVVGIPRAGALPRAAARAPAFASCCFPTNLRRDFTNLATLGALTGHRAPGRRRRSRAAARDRRAAAAHAQRFAAPPVASSSCSGAAPIWTAGRHVVHRDADRAGGRRATLPATCTPHTVSIAPRRCCDDQPDVLVADPAIASAARRSTANPGGVCARCENTTCTPWTPADVRCGPGPNYNEGIALAHRTLSAARGAALTPRARRRRRHRRPRSARSNPNSIEFEALAEAAGARIVDRVVQRRDRVDPATLVGSGKAHEIAELREGARRRAAARASTICARASARTSRRSCRCRSSIARC